MLVKRTISATVLIIICLILVFSGGWIFAIGLAGILSIAAWEFATMFEKGEYAPAKIVMIAGTFLTAVAAKFNDPLLDQAVFSVFILSIIFYHILVYGKHSKTAAFDLAISLAEAAFIAYLGSFLIRIRFLPDGLFWIIISILPAGISDIGAFFIGIGLGKHKIAPDLSPNKTWEGYLGGVFTAVVTGYGAGLALHHFNPAFSGWMGLEIGLITGIFCPLGDLAKSIFKRQFGLKNTGKLIPGHGGVMDRIDTWLWAGIISYFLIQYFLI